MTLAAMGRTNTDLSFGGNRQLKYERFDPPSLAGVPRNPFAEPLGQQRMPLSPEMEAPPKPLDLDLMSDLREVIFNRDEEGKIDNGGGVAAPPINRHVRQLLSFYSRNLLLAFSKQIRLSS